MLLARRLKILVRRTFRRSTDHRGNILRFLPKRAICAEIGVWKGEFTERIVLEAKPKVVHLIDPWLPIEKVRLSKRGRSAWSTTTDQATMDATYEEVLRHTRRWRERGVVQIHRVASLDAASAFADGYFDWVYIDADHRHEAVLGDLRAYAPKVKTGGFIAGDDYGLDDRWWGDGVTRAVKDFVRESGFSLKGILGRQFVIQVHRE